MKLLIDIPKEFEQHFQTDRFDDSLHRLSADAHLLAGLYEQETVLILSEAFKNAIPVPPHGRLVDADKMIWRLTPNEEFYPTEADRFEYDSGKLMVRDIRGFIRGQETIIPADPPKETVQVNSSACEQFKYWCKSTGKVCEFATSFGYCKVTACTKG